VGPLFYHELVRLARRGHGTALRCAYAMVLFVVLFLVYRDRFSRYNLWENPFSFAVEARTGGLAPLAQGFALAVLEAQTWAVYLLTPVYLAGVIAEERERGTLELLLTTRLSDRDIVLGKLAARLTHPGGILLAGLPLLAATELWGGVDFRVLLAAFVLTGLNLLSVGAITVLSSTYGGPPHHVAARAYFGSFCLFGFAVVAAGRDATLLYERWNAIGDRAWDGQEFRPFLSAAAAHVAVALPVTALAVYRLRPHAYFRNGKSLEVAPGADAPAEARPRPTSPVWDQAILWKDAFVRRVDWQALASPDGVLMYWPWHLYLLALFLTGTMVGLASVADIPPGWLAFLNYVARGELAAVAAVWCVYTAYFAAESVGLERDGRTLDGLLALPASGATILLGKGLGAVFRGSAVGCLLALVVAVGLLTGGLHPAALPLVAAAVAVQQCFWSAAGLWFSVTCRTTLGARVATVTTVFLVLPGVFLYRSLDDAFFRDPQVYRAFVRADDLPSAVAEVGANPVGAWWVLAFGWTSRGVDSAEPGLFAMRVGAAAGGTAAFALGAVALWLDAGRRLRKG
jgi:ABC-type transport system involved in multi-copper enzyme maturation permease subunit